MMRFFSFVSRPTAASTVRAALVFVATGLLGACDRHSADEVPENYGHGSSHRRNVYDHQADSTKFDHFSDTSGLPTKEAKEEDKLPPAAAAAPSVSSKGF